MLSEQDLSVIKSISLSSARNIRAQGAEVSPVLLAFERGADGSIGNVTVVPLSRIAKDQWAVLQAALCTMPDVAGVALLSEAWQVFASEDSVPGILDTAPSKHPARVEVLLLSVLCSDAQWLMHCPIDGNTISDAPLSRINAPGSVETHVGQFIADTPSAGKTVH